MTVACHLSIRGRVQGVGFRAFVIDRARLLGLRGWVRNRRDGSVEALLIGEDDTVNAVIADCARGPGLAHVQHLEKQPAHDDGSTDFQARPSI